MLNVIATGSKGLTSSFLNAKGSRHSKNPNVMIAFACEVIVESVTKSISSPLKASMPPPNVDSTAPCTPCEACLQPLKHSWQHCARQIRLSMQAVHSGTGLTTTVYGIFQAKVQKLLLLPKVKNTESQFELQYSCCLLASTLSSEEPKPAFWARSLCQGAAVLCAGAQNWMQQKHVREVSFWCWHGACSRLLGFQRIFAV